MTWLGRNSAIRRVAVSGLREVTGEARQQLLPGQAGALRQGRQHDGPDGQLQVVRRDFLVGPMVHPGLRGGPVAGLVEALQPLAQAAVQEAAGPLTTLVAPQAAEEAAETSAKGTT